MAVSASRINASMGVRTEAFERAGGIERGQGTNDPERFDVCECCESDRIGRRWAGDESYWVCANCGRTIETKEIEVEIEE